MKTSPSPLQAVLRLLLKWWWLIAISVALGVGVGYLVRSRQPDIFYAKTTVLFGQSWIRGSASATTSMSLVNDLLQIYSGLIRRPVILEPVIKDLNLRMSVDDLNSILMVNTAENLPLLEIIVTDDDASRAATIANRIAQEMITQSPTEQVSQETEFKKEQLRGLEQQIVELQTQYDDKVFQGNSLTSAYEIAQNLDERGKLLENIRQLQSLYAAMSAGIADQANQLRIFEYASPDTAPVVGGSITSVILSGAAGLILSITTIVLIGYFDDRLQWQDGLETVLGVKVLGPLGNIPRNKLPLYLTTMPDSIESEVLRQLRAKLVLAAGGVQPKIVTITSYDSGDGKTLTASNLALAAASTGLRTLLIDGDIRKGNLNEYFRLPNVLGLSDVLASRRDFHALLAQALLDSGYENLTILTSGRSTVDPAALLSGPRFLPLINLLKSQFDTIIMDSVPTIGGPDAAFLAETSDGVVIVVDSRRTTQKGLRRILQSLSQARDAQVYGIVFNRVYLQVTATAYQPYYRRNLAVSPERLQRELLSMSNRGTRLSFRRNVLVNKQGERLYSLAASAVQLGITEDTLKNWIRVGYLTPAHYGRRRWIREGDIQALLDKLPRYQYQLPPEFDVPNEAEKNGATGTAPMIPDLLRGQRDALLDYAREPQTPELENPQGD